MREYREGYAGSRARAMIAQAHSAEHDTLITVMVCEGGFPTRAEEEILAEIGKLLGTVIPISMHIEAGTDMIKIKLSDLHDLLVGAKSID